VVGLEKLLDIISFLQMKTNVDFVEDIHCSSKTAANKSPATSPRLESPECKKQSG